MSKMKYTFDDVKNVVNINKPRNQSFLERCKNYMMYVMERQTVLDQSQDTEWMANVKSPTTFSLTSVLYGMFLTSQVNFNLSKKFPKKSEEFFTTEKWEELEITDEEIAQALVAYNEHLYDISETKDTMSRIAIDAILLWTWFWENKYIYVSDEVREFNENWWKIKDSKNYKVAWTEYISPFNIYPDLAWTSAQTSRFTVIRKILSLNTINNYYKWIFNWKKLIDKDKVISWEILEEKDWAMVIKYMMFNNMPHVSWAWMKSNVDWSYTQENMHYDITTDNSFTFWEREKDNKIKWDLAEVYELHTDDDMTLFVNGVKIWVFDKTFPWRKKQFFSVSLKKWLNPMYWIGVGSLWYNLQKMSDMFLNLRMDMSRLEATAPIAVDAWDSYFDWKDIFKPWPWTIIKVADPSKWRKKIDYWYNPNIATAEVDQTTKMIQDSLGISWYSAWVQQKVERVAAWVQELVDSVDRNFADFVVSYSNAMSFIQKYRTIMTIFWTDEEYISNIVWDVAAKAIKNLKIRDIIYEYNFWFSLSPMQWIKNNLEYQKMVQFNSSVWEMTRPDWTPLIDKEALVDMMIEKMNVPSDIKLTSEEALEYMKKQIDSNSELKDYENEKLGMPEDEEVWIIPEFWAEVDWWAGEAVWTQWWIPWIQWGSVWWETVATNPEWIN